ncbi:DUF2779 domain-containing protein [Mycoplasma sp. CSL7503-lung]|uniref:DUF2779 domain-containing protein n=1 Tax=Mycoplasma sp. CSL7503-lung TaxID=536372 RepID=UPI0021CE326C|nr:DUF2779 domain-containing protein [Mycoplasma sp. CSL7503-lung]MCU4706725.1 DUF2779 domain-containing protein [Mycoplasma sp. CSL7503-lung]
MKTIKVTWNIFKKTFGLNPALIWERKKLVDFINSKFNNNQNYDFSKDLEEDNEENSTLFEYYNFEEEDIDLHDFSNLSFEVSNEENDYIKVFKDNYNRYNNDGILFYLKKYNLKNPKYIRTKNNIEVKINDTLNAIKDPDVDAVANGTIGYKLVDGNKTFIFSLPFLIFDKKNKKLVLTSYAKTNFELYYKFFYADNLFKKNNIVLSDMSSILINPYTKFKKEIKKGKIEFYESFAASPSNKVNKPKTKENVPEYYKDFLPLISKTGDNLLFVNNKYDKNNSLNTFFKASKNMIFPKKNITLDWKIMAKTVIPFDKLTEYKENGLNIPFKNPKSSKKENDTIFSVEKYDFYEKIIKKSYQDFENINLDAILYFLQYNDQKEKINAIQKWLSGSLSSYNSNAENIYFDDLLDINKDEKYAIFRALTKDNFERISLSYYSKQSKNHIPSINIENINFKNSDNFFKIAALNKIKQLHKKDAKICWYDYEGFSELYPPMNNVPSYNQIVNQVSIIITQNGNEIKKKNIVCDTKYFKLIDLVKMINEIYDDEYEYYVVYNKAYENTRNKEIGELVNKAFKNNDIEFIEEFNKLYEDKYEFIKKISKINNNTIDLLDCFKHTKLDNKEINDYFTYTENDNDIIVSQEKNLNEENNQNISDKSRIHIKFLNYFSSIKGIEKYINKMNFDLKSKITPYSELVIQKGTMAMEVAILRHVNAISDNVWEQEVVPELKKYCENDVRAMIMVYEFIMFLFRKRFPEIDQFEYKLIDVEGEDNYYSYNSGKLVYGLKK